MAGLNMIFYGNNICESVIYPNTLNAVQKCGFRRVFNAVFLLSGEKRSEEPSVHEAYQAFCAFKPL